MRRARGDKDAAGKSLVNAGVLDVNVAAEARVEEQIPAGVIVVVVDVDFVAVPIPIAAAGSVVSGDDPVGAIEENEAASANVKGANDVDLADVFVASVGIRVARTNASAIIVPSGVMRIVGIVPTAVIAVIVAVTVVIIAVMFVPAFVLAVVVAIIAIVMIVAVALGRGNSQAAGQRQTERS